MTSFSTLFKGASALLISSLIFSCNNQVAFDYQPEAASGIHVQKEQIPGEVMDPVPGEVVNPVPTPTPIVEEPVPTPTPPVVVIPEPVYDSAKGSCASDSSTQLTSCMKCDVPQVVTTPQLSRKAQELLDIVYTQCQTANASDPKDNVAPTKQELLERLQMCSPTLYPDTAFQSASEQDTITRLLIPDQALVTKMFHGLYYTGTYSDNFSTYFGLDVGESRYMFCRHGGIIGGDIYPIEYYQSLYSEGGAPFVMPKKWVKANEIRDNLINCMNESARTKYNPPAADPGYACDYETFAGPAGKKIDDKIAELLGKGYKVGYESSTQAQCGQVTDSNNLPNMDGNVKVAGYKCVKK
jgi:hypothetical protein